MKAVVVVLLMIVRMVRMVALACPIMQPRNF